MREIIYKCDICKKEVKHLAHLHKIRLPVTNSLSIGTMYEGECCGDCISKLVSLLTPNLYIHEQSISWKNK